LIDGLVDATDMPGFVSFFSPLFLLDVVLTVGVDGGQLY
jgi:hypothetical protein